MNRRLYLGLGILILLIGVGCVLVMQQTAPTEQILKPPPQGETFATGHWDGDKWHRAVPKNPETITYKGETLTLDELYSAAFAFEKSWKETVTILNRIIAEAPYSGIAFKVRLYLAEHDENGKSIHDNALLFERLKPLLKYHFDNPSLLELLLRKGMRSHPEEAIRYGKEGLKYVEMYSMNSGYNEYPEYIHQYLGYAYQKIGDYDTALEHLNQALILDKANPGGGIFSGLDRDLVKQHIDRILEGDPALGPLSKTPLLPEKAPPVQSLDSVRTEADKNRRK